MKRSITWALLVLMTLALGAGLARQWQTTVLLQIELEALREQTRVLTRLQADNDRLKRARPLPAEIERARADHEELTRLQTELETLRAKLARR